MPNQKKGSPWLEEHLIFFSSNQIKIKVKGDDGPNRLRQVIIFDKQGIFFELLLDIVLQAPSLCVPRDKCFSPHS